MNKPAVTSYPASLTNYTRGRASINIDMLVIHTEQGSEHGTELWFADPLAHASAHYGIGFDGKIDQFVDDADEAWHAGHPQYNKRSIGIELEGFEAKGVFPDPMIDSLVSLSTYLCVTYGIVADRIHIIGHREVPDPTNKSLFGGLHHHTDPGVHFPWDRFIVQLANHMPGTHGVS